MTFPKGAQCPSSEPPKGRARHMSSGFLWVWGKGWLSAPLTQGPVAVQLPTWAVLITGEHTSDTRCELGETPISKKILKTDREKQTVVMGQSSGLPVRQQPLREKSVKMQSRVLLFSPRLENEPDPWGSEEEEGRPHLLPRGTFGEGNNWSVHQRTARGQRLCWRSRLDGGTNSLLEKLLIPGVFV